MIFYKSLIRWRATVPARKLQNLGMRAYSVSRNFLGTECIANYAVLTESDDWRDIYIKSKIYFTRHRHNDLTESVFDEHVS